jgi:SHS2 domain-containing protein
MRYKLIPHTADIGIRLNNKTIKGLLTDGALALFDILTHIEKVKPLFQRRIFVEALDYDELLNGFLNELLMEFTVGNNLIRKVKILSIEKGARRINLAAIISGEVYDPERHKIKIEIKAVTFHGLYVKKVKSGYQAEVIFDV